MVASQPEAPSILSASPDKSITGRVNSRHLLQPANPMTDWFGGRARLLLIRVMATSDEFHLASEEMT